MPEDPREVEWRQWETTQLAQGRCPDGGGRLRRTRRDGWGMPDGWCCPVCDCFGYELTDPRIGHA